MRPDDAINMRSRIRNGLLAQGFGLGVTIVIQLASIPLFLSIWSLDQYGKWLIISALPTYLALADAGFVSVAINQICMSVQRDEFFKALRTFQNTLALLLILTVSILGGLGLALPWLPLSGFRITLFLLACVTVGNLYTGLFDAIFRSGNQYPTVVALISTGRLVEWLGGVFGLLHGHSYTSVAAGMLIARVCVLIMLLIICRIHYPRFRWGLCMARLAELRLMLWPACSTMAFPLGTALNLSGLLFLLGNLFGAPFVSIFNTYRTLTRSVIQLVSLLNKAVGPEVTRLYGLGRLTEIRQLRVRIVRLTWQGLTACMLGLLFFGPLVIRIWTQDKVPLLWPSFSGLVLVAICNAKWQLDSIILLALNLHMRFAMIYILASCLLLVGVISIGTKFGALGPIGLMIAMEIGLTWAGSQNVRKVVG